MSQCVIDFDTCHQICFPEQHLTGGPGPATLPAAPGTGAPGTGAPGTGAPGNENGNGPKKHKDVTDLDVTDNDGDDNDEDDYEGDQDDNELGMAVGADVGGGETKALHGKGKGNGRSGVKAAAKEAEALTLTPEEINRMQQAYEDVYDESIISAPAGGEDDAEFDDDPSDY
ncbi:hypothetical protein KI688_011954 [Linnemannia hyalina]|uniref:Uncharacterized protein n=1 Tax=Linnemannia hyalina TaxID=64524 RepID=A0A9P7XV31_9FUNG|nr:hypothetical protein KI688_011954 [Linnemannia hyalina]